MILVDVYIPAIDEVLDFELDEYAKVQELMREMTEMLVRRTKSKNVDPVENFLLYDKETGTALPDDASLHSYGIRSGDRLMLV